MGDGNAFTSLFHLYKHKLFSYVLALSESEMLAEDIVQDVFLKLWNEHESLADINNFGSYVFRMSKNHAINHFRRMSHETLIISELFQINPSSHNQVEDIIALKETEKLLESIINRLPAQQKSVYNLSRVDGKSHNEIADLLNISPHTVRNHIIQAMSAIRTQLRGHSNTFFILACLAALRT